MPTLITALRPKDQALAEKTRTATSPQTVPFTKRFIGPPHVVQNLTRIAAADLQVYPLRQAPRFTFIPHRAAEKPVTAGRRVFILTGKKPKKQFACVNTCGREYIFLSRNSGHWIFGRYILLKEAADVFLLPATGELE
jgi:hypothetical protein